MVKWGQTRRLRVSFRTNILAMRCREGGHGQLLAAQCVYGLWLIGESCLRSRLYLNCTVCHIHCHVPPWPCAGITHSHRCPIPPHARASLQELHV